MVLMMAPRMPRSRKASSASRPTIHWPGPAAVARPIRSSFCKPPDGEAARLGIVGALVRPHGQHCIADEGRCQLLTHDDVVLGHHRRRKAEKMARNGRKRKATYSQ